MTEKEAIMIVESFNYQLKAMLQYRKDNNDEIRIDEHMIPEATDKILKMAKSKNRNIVDDIIDKESEK